MSEKRKKQTKPKREQHEQPPRAELPPTLDIKRIGRPSKYDASYCELVLELGAKGKSKAQIAAAIGVSRPTIDAWCEQHPEFLDAIKRARDLALAWWEDLGQESMTKPGFGAVLFIFQLTNRYPELYRRVAGATEEPAKQPVSPQSVGQALGEDRLAPMFARFYDGLHGDKAKPAGKGGNAN